MGGDPNHLLTGMILLEFTHEFSGNFRLTQQTHLDIDQPSPANGFQFTSVKHVWVNQKRADLEIPLGIDGKPKMFKGKEQTLAKVDVRRNKHLKQLYV